MASIEYITKRIEGKQKEITKLEKKLARIVKAQESNWQNNPYYYTENDLKWTSKDLEAAKEALAKYQADLITETEKNNSRNVEAIIRFLNMWAERVFAMYEQSYQDFLLDKAEYLRMNHEYCEWHNNGGWKDPNREEINRKYREFDKTYHMKWNWIFPYETKNGLNKEKLLKELDQEKKAKYDDIIERTNKICGTIKDATGLRVGEKGELNGMVIGERGNARVETIGAGGYNIQCYHFRTLIHEVK